MPVSLRPWRISGEISIGGVTPVVGGKPGGGNTPPGNVTTARQRIRCGAKRRSGYLCPALQAIEAAGVDIYAVRVLTRGVDTLHLSSRAQVEMLAEVAAAYEVAKQTREPQRVSVGGVELAVQPYKLRAGLVLKSDFYVLRVDEEAHDPHPSMVVELSALALWSMGWRQAADAAIGLMGAFAAPGSPVDAQVSRVDLCADWQGWRPTAEDRARFVCRAKRRARFFEGEAVKEDSIASQVEHIEGLLAALKNAKTKREKVELLTLIQRGAERDTQAEYDGGKHFTGFAFGFGRCISARIYDKTREIAVSRKRWVRGVYRHDAAKEFDEARAAWRVEFQLRRQALKEWRKTDDGVTVDLTSWATLKECLPELWERLSLGWLRHGRRTATTRHELSKPWRVLSEAWQCEASHERPALHRQAIEGSLASTIPALAGYVTSAVAQLVTVRGDVQSRSEFSAAINQVLLAAHNYTVEHTNGKKTLETRASEKAEVYEARRRELRLKGDGHHAPRWKTTRGIAEADAEFVRGTRVLGGAQRLEQHVDYVYRAGKWEVTRRAAFMPRSHVGH